MTDLATATVATSHRRSYSRVKRAFISIPYFAFLLPIFVILKLTVDVREVLLSTGAYQITGVEALQFLATIFALGELVRLASPDANSTRNIIAMMVVMVGYILLFTLGAANVTPLQIFSNTEFLMLMLVSAVLLAVGFVLNSRLRARSIDNYAASDENHHR